MLIYQRKSELQKLKKNKRILIMSSKLEKFLKIKVDQFVFVSNFMKTGFIRLATDIAEKLSTEFSCYDDAKNAVNN